MKKLTVTLREGQEIVIDNVTMYVNGDDWLQVYYDDKETYINQNSILHFIVENI